MGWMPRTLVVQARLVFSRPSCGQEVWPVLATPYYHFLSLQCSVLRDEDDQFVSCDHGFELVPRRALFCGVNPVGSSCFHFRAPHCLMPTGLPLPSQEPGESVISRPGPGYNASGQFLGGFARVPESLGPFSLA